MSLYYITDNTGAVYAHDIKTEYAARCILENILRDMGTETAEKLEQEIFKIE